MKTVICLTAVIGLSQLTINDSYATYILNGSFENGIEGWELFGGGGSFWSSADEFDGIPGPHHYPYPNPFVDPSLTIDEILGLNVQESISPTGYLHVSNNLPIHGESLLNLFTNEERIESFVGEDGEYWSYAFPGHDLGLRQSLELQEGQTVSGWSNFVTTDYFPFDGDSAWVSIDGDQIWEKSVLDVWDWELYSEYFVSESGWQQWSWQAPIDGVYDLTLNISGDDQDGSYAFFDHITVSNSQPTRVPDAGSTGLILLGTLPLLLGLRRFFVKQPQANQV